MKKSDTSGYAKLVAAMRKHGADEAIYGSWGGKTLLHHAASYGCMNCVKRLLLDGAKLTKKTGKGLLAMHLARKKGHDAVALLIEFWESPTTNKRIEGGANFDYDPIAAAKKREVALVADATALKRAAAKAEAAEDDGPDGALAKKLGVIVVKKDPPRVSVVQFRPPFAGRRLLTSLPRPFMTPLSFRCSEIKAAGQGPGAGEHGHAREHGRQRGHAERVPKISSRRGSRGRRGGRGQRGGRLGSTGPGKLTPVLDGVLEVHGALALVDVCYMIPQDGAFRTHAPPSQELFP